LILLFFFSLLLGGPYAAFGGRDASRGLATFSVTANENNEYDDLSDLTAAEMESVKEWEMQFKGVYDYFAFARA
jgi:membrane-associated progesterone receptor component